MLSLRTKIIGLIVLAAIIMLGSTFAYHFARTKQEHNFNYVYHENSKASIQSILNIKKESFLKSTLNDAAWDELVAFVRNHRSNWANDNLGTIYETLGFSFIQVYNPAFELLYTVIDSSHFQFPELFIPVENLKKASLLHTSFHFFLLHQNGIMEIFGASIVPTIDIKRKTPALGWLVTGRLWNQQYLIDLQNAANANLEIVPVEKLTQQAYAQDRKEKEMVVVQKFIHDAYGRVIARLDFLPRTQLGLDRKLFLYFTVIPIFVALLVIIIFSLFIRRWITSPLSRIAQSLSNEDPLPLYKIRKKDVEFFAISERMEAFFEAKKKLENEIRVRKFAEERIEQFARELKASNISKDKFFSILAHDLKSPFHALLGYTEILANEYETLTETERKTYIRILRESIKNVYGLLENLLQWSRLQSGKMDFLPETLDLSNMIEEAVDLFHGNALKKNIRVTYRSGKKYMVKADHNMIRSVLQNLISNAIKFTPEGGKIDIMAEKLPGFIEVLIKDTGIGMSTEDLDKLFRIDISYTRTGTAKETGTGLGLILCKELLEKNGGKIWVESETDKGSNFHFTLPCETLS